IGACQDAEAQAARILAKEAQNRDGLYIRGAALLGQGKPQEVLALLEPVSASGTGPELGRLAASALFRLGKVAEAEQAFRATLAPMQPARRRYPAAGGGGRAGPPMGGGPLLARWRIHG